MPAKTWVPAPPIHKPIEFDTALSLTLPLKVELLPAKVAICSTAFVAAVLVMSPPPPA